MVSDLVGSFVFCHEIFGEEVAKGELGMFPETYAGQSACHGLLGSSGLFLRWHLMPAFRLLGASGFINIISEGSP